MHPLGWVIPNKQTQLGFICFILFKKTKLITWSVQTYFNCYIFITFKT